jgi:hypothetical protein
VLDTVTGRVYGREETTVSNTPFSIFEVYEYPTGRTAHVGTLASFEGTQGAFNASMKSCMERDHTGQDAFQIIETCVSEANEARRVSGQR